MKKRAIKSTFGLLVGICGAYAGAASIMEEVIVTAQKREQAITDVPLTITAVTGEVARSMGVEDTRDVAFLATNIDIKGAGMSDANPAVTMRGIGMNNFNANNNPSIGIYMDEVYLASPAMINLSMLDVGWIEVLKGPQGTLYGRNATGGAINIISAKPTREVEGYFSQSIGEYESVKTEAALSGPLGDAIAGRISVLWDSQGESFHEYNTASGGVGNFPDSQTTALRGQLAGDYETVSWNLAVGFLSQDLGNSPFTSLGGYWTDADNVFVTPCDPGDFANCVNTLGIDVADADGDAFTHDFQESRVGEMRIESDVTSMNFNLDAELGDVLLTSVTGWIQQDRDFGENIWSAPIEAFAVVHDEEIGQFSQELRLSSQGDSANWIVGIYYWSDTFESNNLANTADILGILAGANPVTWVNDQETTAFALFGSVDWPLSDDWLLTVGARYSSEDTDFVGGTGTTVIDSGAFDEFAGAELGIPNGSVIPLTEADASISESNADFRVALEWRPSDDLLTYASISSGFKSGGFFGDVTFDDSELEPFVPEEVLAFELGFKRGFEDGRVQLNGSIFRYDYENIQTLVPSAVGFQLSNVEEAEITGAELELLANLATGLDARLGIGVLNTEVSSSLDAFDGNELPNSPELQFTGTVRYEFPLGDNFALALQGDMKHTGDMFRESTNDPFLVTKGYTLLNLRAALLPQNANWEVALWVRNAADEEYEQERFASDIIGQVGALQGNPRHIGATLNINF